MSISTSQAKKAKTRNSGSENLICLKETEILCWILQDYSMTVSLMQLRSFWSRSSQHSLACRACVIAWQWTLTLSHQSLSRSSTMVEDTIADNLNDWDRPSWRTCIRQHASLSRHFRKSTDCCTSSPAIHLQFMNVQMQAVGYDCGLFAVAFATALAFGEPPGQYHFAQEKMRCHLWSCFERRQISMFPYSKLRRATESTVKSVDEVPVYCVCRMPELPNTHWIECSGCKRWYHTESCINVPSKALSTNTSWYCNRCIYESVFCTAQLVFLYIYFIVIMHTLYKYYITNLLAVTMSYHTKGGPKFSR